MSFFKCWSQKKWPICARPVCVSSHFLSRSICFSFWMLFCAAWTCNLCLHRCTFAAAIENICCFSWSNAFRCRSNCNFAFSKQKVCRIAAPQRLLANILPISHVPAYYREAKFKTALSIFQVFGKKRDAIFWNVPKNVKEWFLRPLATVFWQRKKLVDFPTLSIWWSNSGACLPDFLYQAEKIWEVCARIWSSNGKCREIDQFFS